MLVGGKKHVTTEESEESSSNEEDDDGGDSDRYGTDGHESDAKSVSVYGDSGESDAEEEDNEGMCKVRQKYHKPGQKPYITETKKKCILKYCLPMCRCRKF